MVIDRQAFEVRGDFFEGHMEKVKNFHENRFFQKSFISHFEALLVGFPIIETIFLYFEFLLEIYPEISEKSEM
jgi:hypothetical protein